MKKGFTLLELMIVIIIIGILATLGLTQYSRVIEKSRGAEARQILGAVRSNAASVYMQYNNDCTNCVAANVGIGSDYPSACATTHYFSYSIGSLSAAGFTATGTRCTAGGKTPNASAAGTVTLLTNFSTGADTWSTSGQY